MILGSYKINYNGEEHNFTNHITREGLKFLLKSDPQLLYVDPLINATQDRFNIFLNTLNYMFIVISDKSGTRKILDENIYDLSMDDITNFDGTYYGTYRTRSKLYSFEGEEIQIVEGIGVGYKELNGTGENDFIFSYVNLKGPNAGSPVRPNDEFGIVVGETGGIYYASNDSKHSYWCVNASYTLNYRNTTRLPSLKVSVGEREHTFIGSYGAGNYTNIDQLFSLKGSNALGISNWTGPNIRSLVDNPPTFMWYVCGVPSVIPTSFEELQVADSKIGDLTRVFRVSYHNPRPFAVDITGFCLTLGAYFLNYRSEIDDYISLPADKTLEIEIALDISTGALSSSVNKYFDMKNMRFFRNDTFTNNFSIPTDGNVKRIVITQYEGTSRQTVRYTNVTTPNDSETVTLTNPMDELVKVELEFYDGSKSKPLYHLGNNTPAQFNFAAPSINATNDGWVIYENALRFRLNVPVGITKVQFAVYDGVWQTFDVSAGINYVAIPPRFLYEGRFYVRWGDGSSTGLIARYKRDTIANEYNLNIEPLMRAIEPTVGNTNVGHRDPAIVGLISNKAVNIDMVFNGNVTRPARSTSVGIIEKTDSASTSYGVTGYPASARWFNPATMTMDAVPNFVFDMSAVGTIPNYSTYANLSYKPTLSQEEINVDFNSMPREVVLDLTKTPVEARKNIITGYTVDGTSNIEILDGEEILDTFPAKQSTLFRIETLVNLFNHKDYTLRFTDVSSTPLNESLDYKFKGIELDIPEEITDLVYDAALKRLSFTTPVRAVRATITRFDFEIYSFECVPDGLTTLFSTETFDPNGNYLLVLYNAENKPGKVHYIFGEQDESNIRPSTLGPYSYPEWTDIPSNQYATSRNNLAFFKYNEFTPGRFNVRLNNVNCRELPASYNQHGALLYVDYECNGEFLRYFSGYGSDALPNSVPTGNSYIEVIFTHSYPYKLIDLWHEWSLISTTVQDIYGYTRNGAWSPAYGREYNYFQHTAVETGYVKNTLRVATQYSAALSHPNFSQDSTLTAKSPYMNVYFNIGNMYGSYNYYNNREFWDINSNLTVTINGVEATLTTVSNEDDKYIELIISNEIATFKYNLNDISSGWVIDDLDEKYLDPSHVNTYFDITFLYTDVYTSRNYIVDEFDKDNRISYTVGSNIRYRNTNGHEFLFARVYPYMQRTPFMFPTVNTTSTARVSNMSLTVYGKHDIYLQNLEYFVDGNKLDVDRGILLSDGIVTVTVNNIGWEISIQDVTNTSMMVNVKPIDIDDNIHTFSIAVPPGMQWLNSDIRDYVYTDGRDSYDRYKKYYNFVVTKTGKSQLPLEYRLLSDLNTDKVDELPYYPTFISNPQIPMDLLANDMLVATVDGELLSIINDSNLENPYRETTYFLTTMPEDHLHLDAITFEVFGNAIVLVRGGADANAVFELQIKDKELYQGYPWVSGNTNFDAAFEIVKYHILDTRNYTSLNQFASKLEARYINSNFDVLPSEFLPPPYELKPATDMFMPSIVLENLINLRAHLSESDLEEFDLRLNAFYEDADQVGPLIDSYNLVIDQCFMITVNGTVVTYRIDLVDGVCRHSIDLTNLGVDKLLVLHVDLYGSGYWIENQPYAGWVMAPTDIANKVDIDSEYENMLDAIDAVYNIQFGNIKAVDIRDDYFDIMTTNNIFYDNAGGRPIENTENWYLAREYKGKYFFDTLSFAVGELVIIDEGESNEINHMVGVTPSEESGYITLDGAYILTVIKTNDIGERESYDIEFNSEDAISALMGDPNFSIEVDEDTPAPKTFNGPSSTIISFEGSFDILINNEVIESNVDAENIMGVLNATGLVEVTNINEPGIVVIDNNDPSNF